MAELPALYVPGNWIRDPLTKRKNSGARIAAWMLGTVAFLYVFVASVVRIIPHITGRPARHIGMNNIGELIGGFLLLCLAFPVVLFVHEGGHAIGGMLRGWQLDSLFIGPVRVMREDGRLRMRFHQVFLLYGGAILLTPNGWSNEERVRRDFRQLVAAGPLLSLIFGALVLAALPIAGIPLHTAFRDKSTVLVFTLGLMSLAIGFGTLIPIRQGAHLRNDGLQLWILRPRDRNGARPLDPKVRDAVIRLVALARRPRDWSGELLEQFKVLPNDMGEGLRYYRLLDDDDLPAAAQLLQGMIERVAADTSATGAMLRASVATEAAVYEAAWRGDATAARAWLSLAGDAERLDPHGVRLAEAAIAATEGDADAARSALARATVAMHRRSVVRVDLLRAPMIERISMGLS